MITVKEEAEKFEEQAEKDWETILLARAKELAPGKNYNTSCSGSGPLSVTQRYALVTERGLEMD